MLKKAIFNNKISIRNRVAKARFSTWKLSFNPWMITSMQFTILLYGSLTWDFWPLDFYQTTPPIGPWHIGYGLFEYGFKIAETNKIKSCWPTCVIHSAVQPTLKNIFAKDLKHRFFMWKSYLAAHCPVVSLTPLWNAHTAVHIWDSSDFGPHILLSLTSFTGNIYKKNRQIVLHYVFNLHIKNMGVN
jgi:hypothetical protein